MICCIPTKWETQKLNFGLLVLDVNNLRLKYSSNIPTVMEVLNSEYLCRVDKCRCNIFAFHRTMTICGHSSHRYLSTHSLSYYY